MQFIIHTFYHNKLFKTTTEPIHGKLLVLDHEPRCWDEDSCASNLLRKCGQKKNSIGVREAGQRGRRPSKSVVPGTALRVALMLWVDPGLRSIRLCLRVYSDTKQGSWRDSFWLCGLNHFSSQRAGLDRIIGASSWKQRTWKQKAVHRKGKKDSTGSSRTPPISVTLSF